MLKSITQVNQNDKQISKTVKRFFIMQEISRSDISGITTKAPCEVALMGERHVRIEISDFVMRTFVTVQRCEPRLLYSLSLTAPEAGRRPRIPVCSS